jgi:hypothetical protein
MGEPADLLQARRGFRAMEKWVNDERARLASAKLPR